MSFVQFNSIKSFIHRMSMTGLLFLVIIFTLDQSALAQDKKSGKKTVINFEDELVEGQADKPELFYLLQKKQFNYKRMINFRENFLPEMRRSSEDIQRSGSSN